MISDFWDITSQWIMNVTMIQSVEATDNKQRSVDGGNFGEQGENLPRPSSSDAFKIDNILSTDHMSSGPTSASSKTAAQHVKNIREYRKDAFLEDPKVRPANHSVLGHCPFPSRAGGILDIIMNGHHSFSGAPYALNLSFTSQTCPRSPNRSSADDPLGKNLVGQHHIDPEVHPSQGGQQLVISENGRNDGCHLSGDNDTHSSSSKSDSLLISSRLKVAKSNHPSASSDNASSPKHCGDGPGSTGFSADEGRAHWISLF